MSIKVGDWVAFQVAEIDRNLDCRAVPYGSGHGYMSQKRLTKIPPPDPHAALKDAVVKTSLGAHKRAVQEYGADYPNDYWRPHAKACEALLDAQRPPSQYAGLWKAWAALAIRHGMIEGVADIKAELAKLEAEERG